MVGQLDADYARTRPTKVVSRLVSYALFEGRPVTTRGQWINPLVLGQLGLARRLFPARDVRAPIFVVGPGRSGTTILGKVLSMHPDVGFLNEPKAIWHAAVGDEDLIGTYSRGAARVRLDAADATPARCRALRRLYGYYLTAIASRRVLDKYPELVFRIPFLRAVFPDARVLFLVRNGWDTCRSVESWSARHGEASGGEQHDWWGVDDRKWHLLVDQVVREDPDLAPHVDEIARVDSHVDRASVEWALFMREGLAMEAAHPNNVLRVHYETLASEPRATLEQINRFCELPRDERTLDYAERIFEPAPSRPKTELAPWIEPLFTRMLDELGYPR